MQLPGSEEIEYVPWDFKRCANQRGSQILTDISPCIKKSLRLTKIFVVAPSTSKAETEKRAGVSCELCRRPQIHGKPSCICLELLI